MKDIVDHIKQQYKPLAIILHGSRAAKNHRPDSDWDLYIFVEGGKRYSKTELYDSHELDTVVVPISDQYSDGELIALFGSTLIDAEVLFDTKNTGHELLARMQDIYEAGNNLSEDDIEQRKRRSSRTLARLRGAKDDITFFYHVFRFYTSLIRYWYEMRGEWSRSITIAADEIAMRDEPYSQLLTTIATSRDKSEVITAFETIFERLFGDDTRG